MTKSFKITRVQQQPRDLSWYTLEINSWEDEFEGRADRQLALDIAKDEKRWGDTWVVSYRNSYELKAHSSENYFTLAEFGYLADAKRFALALATAIRDGGTLPNPTDFSQDDWNAWGTYSYERAMDADKLAADFI